MMFLLVACSWLSSVLFFQVERDGQMLWRVDLSYLLDTGETVDIKKEVESKSGFNCGLLPACISASRGGGPSSCPVTLQFPWVPQHTWFAGSPNK